MVSESITKKLSRPQFKLVSQMIYGMLSAQSCHLSNIARSLDEKTSLKKTIDRLSRNLSAFQDRATLLSDMVRKVKGCLSDKTVLLFDGSDITKPCSPKMEYIGRVKDGSTGEYGDGYFTLSVTALTPEKKMPIGVYSNVYSASDPNFVSEDEEVLKALRFIGRHFKKSCIRAFDRGYDANIYYGHLIEHNEKFIIRAKKNRNLIYRGRTVSILELAAKLKGKYRLLFEKKNGVRKDCKISIVPVHLPCKPEGQLNLVVCHGFGKDPLMLITNLKSDDKRLAVAVTKVYLMRWRIEEFYGFKKKQFDFEGLRVRSLNSIRNMDLLLTIAIAYLGYMSADGDKRKAVMELIHYSKRIFGTPKFFFYALAAGMSVVFARAKPGFFTLYKRPKDLQLALWQPPRFFST